MSTAKSKNFCLKLSPLALAFSCVMTFPNAAFATNYVVNAISENDDDESTTLNEALYLAKNSSDFDDTITFHSSVVDQVHDLGSHSFNGSGSLSIIGPANGVIRINTLYSDDSEGTVLSMNGSELTLRNLEIIANEAQARDGTILKVEEGALTLNNVVLHGEIKKSGASFRQGIHASNSDVSLTASTLRNFQANAQGSALHFIDQNSSVSLNLLNSSISNNGIVNDEGQLVSNVDSSALYVFSYNAQTLIDINTATFENNNFSASSHKAAALTIRAQEYAYIDVNISGTTFESNRSNDVSAGGALSISGANYTVTDIDIFNSTFTKNTGKHAGAMNLHFEQSENVRANIAASVFEENVGESAASVLNIDMNANSADLHLTLANSNISNNGSNSLSARAMMHIAMSGDARDLDFEINNSRFLNNNVMGSDSEAAVLSVLSSGGYDTSVRINNSTLSGNQSKHPDSIGALAITTSDLVGAYAFEVNIQGSTFDNNSAGAVAVLAVDAGDFYEASVFIANSTITNNGANQNPRASAIQISSENNTNAYFDLVHATVVDNFSIGASANSAAINLAASDENLNVLIANSILVGNKHAANKDDLDFASELRDLAVMSSFVLLDIKSSLFGTALASGDADLDEQLLIDENTLQNVNPELSPLALNGGSTQTRCLRNYSPAINAASKSISEGFDLESDQAGVNRVADNKPDIGAVEYSLACEEADVGLDTFKRKSSGGLFGVLSLKFLWSLFPLLLFRLMRKINLIFKN